MVSSPSSSSSLSKRSPEEPVNEKYRSMANNNKLISNCLIALPLFSPPSPPFLHYNSLFSPPLFKSPSSSSSSSSSSHNSNLHFLLTTTASHIVHNLRSSIASSADRCLGFFHVLSSHNPFLNKLFSLPDDFHNFCQIRRRNYRNMKSLSNPNFAAILPGDSVAGIVVTNGILNFLNIYNTLLVVRLVLTWFPNSPPAIVSPLSTLCDPYLNIFRGIIPPLGGTLDLSPILAFLVLNALTSTASALPAELPELSEDTSSLTSRTTSQKKWMTRFAGNTRKNSKTQS